MWIIAVRSAAALKPSLELKTESAVKHAVPESSANYAELVTKFYKQNDCVSVMNC